MQSSEGNGSHDKSAKSKLIKVTKRPANSRMLRVDDQEF